MAKAKLLGPVEMAEFEARLANMGKELYQIVEDYPALPGWSYTELFMFIHQWIFDEAIKLRKAAILKEREAASTVKFDHVFTPGSTEKVASTQVV